MALAFGDGTASDLEEQLVVLRELEVAYVEPRSAWVVKVVDLDAARFNRAARLLREAGIGVSAIGPREHVAPRQGRGAGRARRALPSAGDGWPAILSVRQPGEGNGEPWELLSALDRSDYHGLLTVGPHLCLLRPELYGAGCIRTAVTALRGLLGEVNSGGEMEKDE